MVTRSTFNQWSPSMQARYRNRWRSPNGTRFLPDREQAPAPSPAAPPPASSPTPPQNPWEPHFNAQYDHTVGSVNRNLANTEAGLNYDEQRVRQQFGFDDPSNPFAVAQMLKRKYEQASRGTNNSYAAQGQLYSGALQTAQDENRFQHEQSTDAARRDYDDLINGILRQRTGARAEAEDARRQAEIDRLGAQVETRPEDPGSPEPQATEDSNRVGVTWATWGRWDEAQKKRYRDRHRHEWDKYRPS